MPSFHEMLVYFVRAWAEVTNNLYFAVVHNGEDLKILCPETSYASATKYQYGVVILSIAFFYMICYSLHGLIEDRIRLYYHKKEMESLRSRAARSVFNNDDSST